MTDPTPSPDATDDALGESIRGALGERAAAAAPASDAWERIESRRGGRARAASSLRVAALAGAAAIVVVLAIVVSRPDADQQLAAGGPDGTSSTTRQTTTTTLTSTTAAPTGTTIHTASTTTTTTTSAAPPPTDATTTRPAATPPPGVAPFDMSTIDLRNFTFPTAFCPFQVPVPTVTLVAGNALVPMTSTRTGETMQIAFFLSSLSIGDVTGDGLADSELDLECSDVETHETYGELVVVSGATGAPVIIASLGASGAPSPDTRMDDNGTPVTFTPIDSIAQIGTVGGHLKVIWHRSAPPSVVAGEGAALTEAGRDWWVTVTYGWDGDQFHPTTIAPGADMTGLHGTPDLVERSYERSSTTTTTPSTPSTP